MSEMLEPLFASKSSPGYVKLPGGIILQWGSIPTSTTGVSFPIEFPNALLNLQITDNDAVPEAVGASARSRTGFNPATAEGGEYLAIGY